MMENNKVTVLMACKDSNKELLANSVNSVIRQSFKDFEFVIVDDGSQNPIEPIIRKITKDSRIKVLRIHPSGLGAALNFGADHSTGKYIARIDDDDLMAYERLQKQVAFLDKHPEVSCVGSHRYTYCKGKYIEHRKFAIQHKEIVESMLSLKWAMAHTALMFRRESFKEIGGYRIKGAGQDYDLILQLSLVGELANIDEYLSYYHLTSGSYSSKCNTERLNAYLFAFEELNRNSNYVEYSDIIDTSIRSLSEKVKENKTSFNWRKWALIQMVRLKGKKVNYENL